MKKFLILFLIMGMMYLCIEVIFTAIINLPIKGLQLIGQTSLWMLPVGGLLGVLLGLFNQINWVRKTFNVFWQCFIGAILITLVEFGAGLLLNIVMGLNLWDYSQYLLNVMAQVCVPMSICWFFLCPFVFWFDDILRFYLYKEGNIYSLWSVYKDLFLVTKSTSYQTSL